MSKFKAGDIIGSVMITERPRNMYRVTDTCGKVVKADLINNAIEAMPGCDPEQCSHSRGKGKPGGW